MDTFTGKLTCNYLEENLSAPDPTINTTEIESEEIDEHQSTYSCEGDQNIEYSTQCLENNIALQSSSMFQVMCNQPPLTDFSSMCDQSLLTDFNSMPNQSSVTDMSSKPNQLFLKDFKTMMFDEQFEILKNCGIPNDSDAPKLTYILQYKSEFCSKIEEYLMYLDCMKRIQRWLGKIEELNKYNAARFQVFIEKMIDFNRLVSIVKEKQTMVELASNASHDASSFELSVYDNLQENSRRIMKLLESYKSFLNSTIKKQNRLRVQYLEYSIEATMYEFEDKLFEDRRQTIDIINHATTRMNGISVKLERNDDVTHNISMKCISFVKMFLDEFQHSFS